MRKYVFAICLLAFVFTAFSAVAQNKVVVVPLGSSAKVPGSLKTISVSSLGGIPKNTSNDTTTASTCGYLGRYTTGSADNLAIPIQIPDGATVTSFNVLFCDNSNGYRGVASLERSDGTMMAQIFTTSGVVSTTPTEGTTSTIGSATIDNSLYSYWIEMSLTPSEGVNIYPISAYVTIQ